MIDLKLLVKNGVQFGHQTWRWNPKMAPYIWGEKNGVHLIDVSKTAYQAERAAQFLEQIASQGRSIVWCGTKKAAQGVLRDILEQSTFPRVTHRWIGGTLTNYSQVKKSITKLLHSEDELVKADPSRYTKKELNVLQKSVERLQKNVGGLRTLIWPVAALVIIDVKKEHVALKEAIAAGIPIIALIDTNGDPSGIDYVIPCNDDAPKAISIVIDHLVQAALRGAAIAAAERPQEEHSVENTLEKMIAQVLGADETNPADKPAKKTGPQQRPRRVMARSQTRRPN
jgi:small subunit ribosomal protein S2